ncbi:hypothetical protein AVDCRST_MAG84-3018 [uncultured Microcoleus sp.]|uniref:Uncharacterized protein n=1 Tax=uncultured Microcoleus sp. TaxID=259945 RepID=A0A6J4MA35_9CYAN|nr:hypothetical protein AVDCRST_MAG84-3018 [uncultured Microcoleus sp.]
MSDRIFIFSADSLNDRRQVLDRAKSEQISRPDQTPYSN